MQLIRGSKILFVCLLAFSSVTAFAQVSANNELLDKVEIQRTAQEMNERVKRMNIMFENDASGRLTRITREGVATDVIYDANGKVDGYTTNGTTIKVRMATDINHNPVMRFFDSKGNELQPVDLKSVGIPQPVIDSISGDKVMLTADTIDVKDFAWMELQRASQRSIQAMSIRAAIKSPKEKSFAKDCQTPGPDGDCLDGGGGTGGGVGAPHFILTPQQQRLCILKCDLDKERGLNYCERLASQRQFACAAGGVLLLEVPPLAGGATAACLAYSADVAANCRDGIAGRNYSCAAACE